MLIAVNPFKAVPGQYSPDVAQSYRSARCTEPHVYLVADQASAPPCNPAQQLRSAAVPREDGLTHPGDTPRSNLAAALGLLSSWRPTKAKP